MGGVPVSTSVLQISISWLQVTHVCNPSYLAQANSSRDPTSKMTRAKWTGGEAQVIEYLVCKCEALSSHPKKFV
jgi:hypothetical protein